MKYADCAVAVALYVACLVFMASNSQPKCVDDMMLIWRPTWVNRICMAVCVFGYAWFFGRDVWQDDDEK